MGFATCLQLLAHPVSREKRALLAERWAGLTPEVREGVQGFGRQTTGCGALIGAMPKCDFDCEGCYLTGDANAVPRAALGLVFDQLARLRRRLGPKANVQLTDGELTLLPEAELLAIVREARRLGAIPMLMTHGDSFRRLPDLLPHLMEAGLTEVSIHVDSLQRGRRAPYGAARTEVELEPLRDELADIVRAARRSTGLELRAATTLTIAGQNLDQVVDLMAPSLARRDAFSLISFQPLAAVGRTREHLTGVTADDLWRRIASGLEPFGFDGRERSPLRLGHPDCTRLEPMLAYARGGEAPRLVRIARPGSAWDEEIARRFLDEGLGGMAFRDDPPAERWARAFGAIAAAPAFWFTEFAAWLDERTAELGTTPARLALELARGAVRLDGFQVVSHHFMSPSEAASERGRERLAACVFHVMAGERPVPMCEANALGVREEAYVELRGRPQRGLPYQRDSRAGETPKA
jgi:molybdenum cofactor biosynthesis enzyme MoaA